MHPYINIKEGKSMKNEHMIKSRALRELLSQCAFYIVYITLSTVLSAIFVLCCTGIVNELRLPMEPVFAVSSLGFIFSAYSVSRAAELYNLGRRQFFISKLGDKYSLRRDLAVSFSGEELPYTLIRIGTPALLAFLSPIRLGYGFIMRSLTPTFTALGGSLFLWKGLIVCPVLIFISLLAETSAHKWWIVARTAEREKLDRLTTPVIRTALEILKISVIYCISFAVLPAVIMLFVSLVLTFGVFSIQPWIIPVVAVIIPLPPLVRRVRHLLLRRRYFRRTLRSLRAAGYTVEEINHPIRSVLRHYAGASFVIRRGDDSWAVKLVSSGHRRRPVYINTEGFFTAKQTVSFMKINLFHIMHDYEYAFESEHKKLVVFSPMPHRVFLNYGRCDTAPDDGDGGTVPTVALLRSAITSGGASSTRTVHGPGYISDVDRGIIKPFETGEVVSGYKFFSPRGFVSAADNSCLDR